MKKYLIVLAFAGLLEYQVLFHHIYDVGLYNPWLEYSPVTAGGLMLLCLYQIFIGTRGFLKTHSDSKARKNLLWKSLAVAVYLAIIIGGSLLANNFGEQFVVLLFTMALGLSAVSIYEFIRRKKQEGAAYGKKWMSEKAEKVQNTRISAFTIPIIYLYVINFLIGAQIGHNVAFQFILVLSCLILYDNLSKEEEFVQKFTNKVNDFELRHYIFHRWSKYFDFFLGTWFFIGLHLSGTISLYTMLVLIFLYMCIFFTVLLRITYHFNVFDFLGIVLLSGALTLLPAAAYSLADLYPPAFAVAAFIFLGFDLGDIYWHSKHFAKEHRATPIFWFQKAAIYLLVFIFIWQLHNMETNPLLSINNVYTSVLGTSETMVQPESAVPIIDVPDVENAAHVRGE